jgi:hypothetical protein
MGTAPSSDQNPEELKQLFQTYKKRHTNFYNWGFFYWLTTLLPRGFKKDPYRSPTGALLTTVNAISIVLLPVVTVTGLAGAWVHSYMPIWIGVSVIYGVLMAAVSVLTVNADEEIVNLHGSMATVQGLRRLIAWDRRWFNYVVEALFILLFMLLGLMAFFVIYRLTNSPPLPIGTQVLGLYVFLFVGALLADLFLLACETPLLVREEYHLFRHNPSQTQSLRCAMGGYNKLVANDSMVFTVVILISVILLPTASDLLMPVILMLLGLVYSSVALIMLTSRYLIGRIIRTAKEQELAGLQARISVLWGNVLGMNEDEFKELDRLEKSYDRLAATPQTLLNPGRAISIFMAAVFLPTLSTIVTYALGNVLK